MSEKSNKFAKELDRLIKEGDQLHMAIQYDCHKDSFVERLNKVFKNNDEKVSEYIKNLPDFKSNYQKWYSESQAVIKQVLPDRFSDFVSYFEFPRVRKNIDFQNYMIRDYLQGLRVSRGSYDVIVDSSAAIPEFAQQLNLVEAAKGTLDSTLMDIKAVLQADLFDTEIETAAALSKAGYLRACFESS